MPAGFGLLVQYVDTLAEMEGMPMAPLAATWRDGGAVDFTQATILASSRKSLVVRLTPTSDSVVKISSEGLVNREREIHMHLDGRSPHLRRMPELARHAQLSSGLLSGLGMLELAGFGKPLQTHHMERNSLGRERVWQEAAAGLAAMHAGNVLHRDVKPSNLIVINGSVQLNDFDVSCKTSDDRARQVLSVGTQEFKSPKLVEQYEERDDWLGLPLTLLKLEGIDIDITVPAKLSALRDAVNAYWLPQSMRDCIRRALDS